MVDPEAQPSHEHTMAGTKNSRNSRTSFSTYELGTLKDEMIDLPTSPLLDQQE